MTWIRWHLFPWIYLFIVVLISPNHHFLLFNLTCFLCALTGILLRRQKIHRTYFQLTKLLFLTLGITILLFSPWRFASIEMGSNILLLLCLLKTYELDSARDSIIFCLMAHLLFVTALLNMDQLYYLPLIILSPVTLLSYMRFSTNHLRVAGLIQTKLFTAAFAITSILFFIFPRVQFGGINWFSNLQIGLTGHQEKLVFEDFSKQLLDPTVVFRAELESDLAYHQLYWKGATLHATDGKNWERGHFRGVQRQYLTPKFNYQVDYELPYQGDLFTLDGTAKIRINRFSNAINGANENWSAVTAGANKLHFSAEIWNYQDSGIHPKSYDQLTRIPNSLPIFWKAQANSSTAVVSELIHFFNTNGFSYDITAPGGQTVAELLTTSKKGHCAHYASAAALMLRQNMIPARVVVGYHGGEYNPLGNYYVIRQLDAHAWTEYWDGKKWQTLDLTAYLAPSRLSDGANIYSAITQDELADWNWLGSNPMVIFKRLKLVTDLAYYRLNTRFSNYDAEEQRKLFQKFKTIEPPKKKQIVMFVSIILLLFAGLSLLITHRAKQKQSPWQLLLQRITSQGVILEKNITPQRLMKKYPIPELQQILLEIEQNSFDRHKTDRRELTQRIRRLKYPF